MAKYHLASTLYIIISAKKDQHEHFFKT